MATAISEKVLYCQVDAHLDTNPKIVKAACGFATAVYQFFLRRVKVLGNDGWLPASNADPVYLAKQLHFTEEQVSTGLSRLSTVDLVDIGDSGDIAITGWSDEWAGTSRTKNRPPLTDDEKRERERAKKAKWRKGAKSDVHQSTDVPGMSTDVHRVPGCPVDKTSEERRGEEIRGEDPERERRAPAYVPAEPTHRGDLATKTWSRLSRLRVDLAAELRIAAVAPLTAIGVAEPRGFRDLRDRIREEGPDAPAVCGRVLASIAAEARRTRSVEWVSEKVTTEGAWRTAKERTAQNKPKATTGRAEVSTDPNAFTDGERKFT